MKKNCLNCHFFCKEHRESNGDVHAFSLKPDERKVFASDPVGFDRGWYSLNCNMGVWDEGVSSVASSEDKILFSQDRGTDCFFIPYKQSMLLPAAVELQKRAVTNHHLKKSHRLVIIGLWIAGIGLIINGVVSLINLIKR
jgi:hypothetical protein